MKFLNIIIFVIYFFSTSSRGQNDFILKSFNDQIDFEEAQLILNENEKNYRFDRILKSENEINKDVDLFFNLLPKILASKVATIHFYNRIKKKLKLNQALTGRELRSLQTHIYEKLNLQNQLIHFVEDYSPFLMAFERSEKDRLVSVMLMLSSTLLLLDNYFQNQKFFVENNRLRRILDEGNSQNGDFLNSILHVKNFKSIFKKIHAIRFVLRRSYSIRTLYKNDQAISKLMKMISYSKSFQFYQTNPFGTLFSEVFKHFTEIFWLYSLKANDKFRETISSLTFTMSKVFGNMVGEIAWRDGLLKGHLPFKKLVKKVLQPMDILMEKTPFRLTDQFIPGFWGHIALWIGNKKQLKQLGIWNHPLVKKYHTQIIKNRGIVEALRPGVQINTVEHFMNIDSLAIIRHRKLSKSQRIDGIFHALKQIGKNYDFNFDIETQNSLVCSELIYVSYSDISWQTNTHFGRFDILPDDIAIEALEDGIFDLKLFIFRGKEIQKSKTKMNIFKEILSESLNFMAFD